MNETQETIKRLCHHCKEPVHTQATRCPHCQGNIKQWYKTWWGATISILFFPIVLPYLVWKETAWSRGAKISITVICVIILVMAQGEEKSSVTSSVSETTPQTPESIVQEIKQPTPEEIREKKIEGQFSIWDGSHRGLTKVIKNSMNDPESYKHVETRHWIMDDHIIVSTTFRGTNAFGGTVANTVKAKVSLEGEVLEILEQI
jgi:hypothetical protein